MMTEFDEKDLICSFVVKAPGKCLLTGGYLILEPNQKGLSVSVDAFTQATVKVYPISTKNSIIRVESSDLCENWSFSVSNENSIEENENNSPNPFLYQSIRSILNSGKPLKKEGKEVFVSIKNCNGFYYKNQKTGFGTSSTTVVSFITSLLLAWECISFTEVNRSLITDLSLQSHFLAQGKVGSGYDIVTAVYGTCIFEKKEDRCAFEELVFPETLEVLFSCGGNKSSKTSTFVKRIQNWRIENDANEEVSSLWLQYKLNNQRIIDTFKQEEIDLKELKYLFSEKLDIMYSISKMSNTEIVPDVLYELMKKTMLNEDVVGCVVAGAGGYDSFYCIVKPSEEVKSNVSLVWEKSGYSISSVKVKGDKLTITKYYVYSIKQLKRAHYTKTFH